MLQKSVPIVKYIYFKKPHIASNVMERSILSKSGASDFMIAV